MVVFCFYFKGQLLFDKLFLFVLIIVLFSLCLYLEIIKILVWLDRLVLLQNNLFVGININFRLNVFHRLYNLKDIVFFLGLNCNIKIIPFLYL